ncbi:creatininase family protein [Candidatus Bathyarchaeota archaeon]|nr:creatininase family protein [Candidatus Bathyarchaeota archaeon]
MVNLSEMSWIDVQDYLQNNDTAILPIGSIEQHGPHAPIGTDFFIAEAASKKVGDNTNILVLPIIPISVSEHHRQFTGTLWVEPSIFRSYIKSIILSAASHGLKKFVIINGHGGNTPSLLEISEDLRRHNEIFVCIITAFPPKLDGHAGKDETSIILYLKPELINEDKIIDSVQNKYLGSISFTKAQRIDPAEFGWDTIDLSESGVYGGAGKIIRTTEATVDRGEEIFNKHIKDISEFLIKIKNIKIDELLPKKHK